MTVESQGRVPKQKDFIGHNLATPRGVQRRAPFRRERVAGARRSSVHNIVLFDQRTPKGADYFVPNQDKHEFAATSVFDAYVYDRRCPPDGLSDAQRLAEDEAASRPHAPWQRDRRQKVASFRMSVQSNFGLAMGGKKIQPVPKRGQRVSEIWRRVVAVEKSRKAQPSAPA